MASYYKDKKGRWKCRHHLTINGHSENIRLTAPKDDNTKVALEKLLRERIDEVESRLVKGMSLKVPLFERFAQQWLEVCQSELTNSTYVNYKTLVNKYLIPELGNRQLDHINRADVDALATKIERGKTIGTKTLNNALACLRRILKYAVECQVIAYHPPIRLRKYQQPPIEWLREDELSALLAQELEPDIRLMILLGAHAGLRIGEIVCLQWTDIDFKAESMTIQRADSLGKVSDTKSHRVRSIPLTPELLSSLKSYPVRRVGSPWVLWTEPATGILRRYTKDPQRLETVGKHCGCSPLKSGKPIGWHTLRHTFCTTLILRGADIATVKELAGHSSIATTMRYTHVLDSTKRKAISLLSQK